MRAREIKKLSYTYSEAAQATGLSSRTLRRLGERGAIRLVRIPGCRTVLIDAASVQALLQRGAMEAINA